MHEGSLALRGGKADGAAWDESLVLRRASWYSEALLLYDLLHAEVGPSSPFSGWLSPAERRGLDRCSPGLVVMAYAMDGARISHQDLLRAARAQGFERTALPVFRARARTHPDFRRHALHLYDVHGLCARPGSPGSFTVSFPNFDPVRVP